MAAVLPMQSFTQQQVVYSMAPTRSTEQHVVYSVAPTPVHYAHPQVYQSVPVTHVSHQSSSIVQQGEAALTVESKPESEEPAQDAQETKDGGVETQPEGAPIHTVAHSVEQPAVYSVAPTYSMAAPVQYATWAQPHVYQSAPVTYVTHQVAPTVVQQNVATLESTPESDEPRHGAQVEEPKQEGEEPKQDAEEPKQEENSVQEHAPVVPAYAAPAMYAAPAVYAASPTLLTSHATMPLKIGETVDGGVNPTWSARYVYNGVEYTTFDAYHAGVKTHVEGTAADQEATPAEEAPVAEVEKTVRAVKPMKKGCC